jgi:hypothetical protein
VNWKDEKKALTKLYPRLVDDEEEITEFGSFFNFFEHEADTLEVRGHQIIMELALMIT